MLLPDLFLGATVAMLATSLGAAGVLGFKKLNARYYPIILSFCAGVMIFSSIEMLTESHALSGHFLAFVGLLCGLLAFFIIERALPHIHNFISRKALQASKKKAALLAGTISIHNIPEGFAIASAFASSSPLGWLVTTSIALQDIPEGLTISAPLACCGVSTRRSFLWGVFSGFVEFAAAIAGYLFLSTVTTLSPFALAFSAGAMSYVALFELFLESLKDKNRHMVALSFVIGIATAFALASVLKP